LEEGVTSMALLAENGYTEPLITAFINILKKIDNRDNKSEKDEPLKMELEDVSE
jgi:hypothetical protein